MTALNSNELFDENKQLNLIEKSNSKRKNNIKLRTNFPEATKECHYYLFIGCVNFFSVFNQIGSELSYGIVLLEGHFCFVAILSNNSKAKLIVFYVF